MGKKEAHEVSEEIFTIKQRTYYSQCREKTLFLKKTDYSKLKNILEHI